MLFLTGGSGLLGLHILAALQARGHRVQALVRTEASAAAMSARGAEPLLGRIDDPRLWRELSGCTGIVHAAAQVYGTARWDDYLRVNVEGTRLAAERARQLDVPFIHISSVAVYGPRGRVPPGSADEMAPVGDAGEGGMYARSKRLAEQAVWREGQRGLRSIVLRPCVVYGEGDRLFLPNLIRRARRGWLPVIGDGGASLALVYAGNVAQAVIAALEASEGWGRAYNVTNDAEITGAELVTLTERGLGSQVRPVRVPRIMASAAAHLFDVAGRLVNPQLPGLGSAIRFLGDGNPYTSRAAQQILKWSPRESHVAALPRAIRAVATRQPSP